MHSIADLTGSHLRTYNAIFQHPISHNLGWRDVHALFSRVGEVAEEPNGNLRVTRNGQSIVLHPARTKDVTDMKEMMALRHFLERSEAAPPLGAEKDAQWLLVIDQHKALIFRAEIAHGAPLQIRSQALDDDFRPAHDQKKPSQAGYFEPVAKALQTEGQILIFGSGTGESSEMDQFTAWLRVHHPEVAKRIVGSQVVDQHHLTGDQLLAKAREFYAKTPTTAPAQR